MSRANKQKALIILTCILSLGLISTLVVKQQSEQAKTIRNEALLMNVLDDGQQIIIGQDDAPHTLVLFYDYNCSNCRHFFNDIYPSLNTQWIEPGLLKLILKPVNLGHNEEVSKAYQLIYCLNKLGLFQDIHEVLMIDSDIVHEPEFGEFVDAACLENNEIAECISRNNDCEQVHNNKVLLNKLGAKAVPLFVLGNKTYKGNLSTERISKILSDK